MIHSIAQTRLCGGSIAFITVIVNMLPQRYGSKAMFNCRSFYFARYKLKNVLSGSVLEYDVALSSKGITKK